MKVGLLPLYIAIYDQSSPHCRPRLEAFYDKMEKEIEQRDIEVVRTKDFCRLEPEFKEAVAKFEEEKVDAIVTLHMAYSPSLESIEVLANTSLPLVVLDTTETLEFTNLQSPGEIMYNHGIHGVMDMCSMLKRYGKPYAIAAGHHEESNVIDRVCGFVRAAVAAKALSKARVALFGGAFDGMGDFAVEPAELKERFGIEIDNLEAGVLDEYASKVDAEDIQKEVALDKEQFDFDENIDWEKYGKITSVCLGVRKCLEEKGYTAFSSNFRNVKAMPFIECCKALQRRIGYAGEGDGLTAAFVGALMNAYPETNFVEIFCPDWKNDQLFLSHMGETNYQVIDGKPFVTYKGGFVDTYAAYARMKGGKGVYVNISRDKDDYQLFVTEAEMLSYNKDSFPTSMRGWMKPQGKTTAEFLEEHSKYGATHHSIFVYGATVEEIAYFGKLLNMAVVTI